MPSKKRASAIPITVHTMEAELKFSIDVSHQWLVIRFNYTPDCASILDYVVANITL